MSRYATIDPMGTRIMAEIETAIMPLNVHRASECFWCGAAAPPAIAAYRGCL